jgi:hypothetical protein
MQLPVYDSPANRLFLFVSEGPRLSARTENTRLAPAHVIRMNVLVIITVALAELDASRLIDTMSERYHEATAILAALALAARKAMRVTVTVHDHELGPLTQARHFPSDITVTPLCAWSGLRVGRDPTLVRRIPHATCALTSTGLFHHSCSHDTRSLARPHVR